MDAFICDKESFLQKIIPGDGYNEVPSAVVEESIQVEGLSSMYCEEAMLISRSR